MRSTGSCSPSRSLVAARVLSAALGGSAPLWVALAAFGSITFRSVHQLLPELHALLGVVVAAALVWARRARLETGPEQIYAGDLPSEASIWRWPFAGLALGVAAVRSPIYLLLALPMAVDLPQPRRGVAASLFILGLAAPLAFVSVVAGLPWAPPDLVATPALLGWNTLYAFVGRSAGILVWFPALVALLAFARRRGAVPDGRAWLPYAALAALLLQVALHPFDWAGDRIAAGNVWFLPIYGALWFALDPATADARRAIGSAIAVAALGGVTLLPLWLHPTVPIPAPPPVIGQIVGTARSYLPSESTLREIPGAIEIRRGEIRLRTDDPAIGASGDRLVWAGSRQAVVEVASDRPLGSIRFEVGERAPSSIEILGGEAGETTFRPGGELAIDVRVRDPARRHPLWWSRGGASIYYLRLALPQPAGEPIPFDVASARPAGITPAPEVKP